MAQYKLAIILLFFWITASCQQIYNQSSPNTHPLTGKPDSPATTKQMSEPESDKNANSNSNQITDTTIKASNIQPNGEGTAKSKISDNKTNTSSLGAAQSTSLNENETPKSFAQEKIDQALELCNFAQEMWENGKIEEALANLDSAYYSILEVDPERFPEFNQQKEDVRYLISKRILEIYASRQIVVNGQHNEIPITMNAYVEKEIKRLTGPERKFFIQSLERSGRYRPFIVSELKKAGLPEEISWLPLIESGFKIRALSKARALGLWQFIPSTGYKFGLNRNYYTDERLDPEKATLAAINYLKELHNLFGDWTTALAAYNCGESRVLRIIRRQRINYLDNFWDLYQNLPRETSRYVPRFLATLHIINNLEKYGIKAENIQSPVEYKLFEVKKQVQLKDIASAIGESTTFLKDLNPELRYALLPPEPYQLKIPKDKAALFLSKIDTIKTTYSPPPMYVYHRVRRGETLSGIAQKYKTSIRAISSVNKISKNYRIIAGKMLKIPSRAPGVNVNLIASNPIPAGKSITYKVKRGDNLWKIARKFGTTTKNIMATNKLRSTNLSIGQTLKLSSAKQSITAKSGTTIYKVKSGDSPFSIAKKHKMNLNRFLALNKLDKRSKIYPGQKLIIE